MKPGRWETVVLVLALAGWPQVHGQDQETALEQRATDRNRENAMEETRIRRQVEEWAKAIGARDLEGVMSIYTPDIVSFDVDPPLAYTGIDNKRRAWREFFAVHDGPVGYEMRDLRIAADGDVAFADSLNHVSGKLANGHSQELWVRWTACFRRINGAWRIVHDHASVPADLKQGRARLDLKP